MFDISGPAPVVPDPNTSPNVPTEKPGANDSKNLPEEKTAPPQKPGGNDSKNVPEDKAPSEPSSPDDPSLITSGLASALLGADLRDLVIPLHTAGYRDLADLGTTAEKVAAAVKAAAPKVLPGELARLQQLWSKATTKGSPAIDLPKLPEGAKVDLSQSTVTFEDVSYKIPSEFATTKSDKTFKEAYELSSEDWMVVAKRTGVLRGINLEGVFASGDALRQQAGDGPVGLAGEAALVWVVPSGDAYLDASARVGTTEGHVHFAAELSNLVHQRLESAAVSVASPFVSANASVARKAKEAKSQARKTMYLTGLYRNSFAELVLEHCTGASDGLIAAVDVALAKPADQRFDALRSVFQRFGHVVPGRVAIGGQLYLQNSYEMVGEVVESQAETVASAAVSAKYGAASGQASASLTDATGAKVDSQRVDRDTSFVAVGGDITLNNNPSQWGSTTRDPGQWAVVNRSGLRPVVDLLPERQRAAVRTIWQDGLATLWGGPAPVEYVVPDLDGLPFTLSSGGVSGELLRPVHLGGRAVGVAPPNYLADAIANGVTWELLYTGRTQGGQGRGRPIYRVIEHQDTLLERERLAEIGAVHKKNAAIRAATGDAEDYEPVPVRRVALSAVRVKGTWWAGCVDAAVALADNATLSDASWTLVPVEVPGLRGLSSYALVNVGQGKALGAVTSSAALSDDASELRTVALQPLDPASTGAWLATTFNRRALP